MPDPKCRWCEKSFSATRARQVFCAPGCRASFHTACRLHGERLFDLGQVGLRELKDLRA
jgi:uncharacterized CHY-type Zn-finger protein